MPRKLKRYLVGYDQEHQTIYGKNEHGRTMYADPMTLKQAQRILKQLESHVSKTIYKLVPVRQRKP